MVAGIAGIAFEDVMEPRDSEMKTWKTSPIRLSLALLVIWFIAQQLLGTWLGDQFWWKAIPAGWVLVALACVFAGAVWAETRYPESELRQWWQERGRCFDVEACFVSQEGSPHDHFALICVLKFIKDVRDKQMRVRVRLAVPHHNGFQLIHDEKVTASKDAVRRLRLGSFNIPRAGAPARHNVWGERLGAADLAPGQQSIIGGAPTTIEVTVGAQKFRAFLFNLPVTTGAPAPAVLVDEDTIARLG